MFAVGTLRERVFGGLRMVDKHKARLGFVGLGGFFVEWLRHLGWVARPRRYASNNSECVPARKKLICCPSRW